MRFNYQYKKKNTDYEVTVIQQSSTHVTYWDYNGDAESCNRLTWDEFNIDFEPVKS